MKSYVTSGTGSQQTLTGSQDEKVAVYQTLADAEADLANLEAGQIVATPDTGDEYAQPVDVIQAGNMHAVTSNAVATSNAMPVDEVTLNNVHSVTSNAVAQALMEKLNQGVKFGNDNSTSTITLGAGMYMFLCNFHPLVNQTGLYFISIASRPDYNRVFTVDNNSTITLSVSSSSNVLTLTTTTVFRGLLVKVSDSPAV